MTKPAGVILIKAGLLPLKGYLMFLTKTLGFIFIKFLHSIYLKK